MKAIMTVTLESGKKSHSFVDQENLPVVPKALAAQVIGQGGVIVAVKNAGEDGFTMQ
jgi:hypothetical protein